MSFTAGENVGPYRIIEQLGQGGMASVFKAYHPALDRYVAIKVLHPAFKEDPNFLSRFQREARVVARLEHPHIVPIYDFAEHKGQPYLVMKFIEGVTLKARLAQKPLTKDEAIDIVMAVGSALSYAHGRGVLHRDIKPSNILLSPDGGIYLADFGLARIAEAGASTLSKDVMLGTPQYISPEQAKGLADLDECTDVYSLGVVLYEIVVGRVPFNADTPFSIIHDHIYTPLPPPSTINPHVPARVEAVLMKALEKERANRYQNVDALTTAFKTSVLGLEGGPAEPISAAKKVRMAPTQVAAPASAEAAKDSDHLAEPEAQPPKRRKRWPWIAAGIGITLVCLLAFLASANRGDQTSRNPSDSVESPAASEQVEVPTIEPGMLQNPDRHFERANLLLGEGHPLLAAEEFFRAGELYLRRDEYTAAANSFWQAYQSNPAVLQRSRDTAELIAQSFYLAAEDPGSWAMIDQFVRARPEWALLPIINARAQLYQGSLDEARAMTAQVLRDDPSNHYALSLLAEIHLQAGETVEAERILEKELSLPDELPAWLFEHLQKLKRNPG
ncbi:MAG: protein kinase [Anaerolineales bacterium]|jgi:tetratricopeptide (TPR) repeat protein